jgi:hypothetical protein
LIGFIRYAISGVSSDFLQLISYSKSRNSKNIQKEYWS